MKGKPTWKPMGLTAKKWHEPGQARDGVNLSAAHVPRRERKRRKTAAGWPVEPAKTS